MRKKNKLIASIIMAMMMVLAMVPNMAFAADGDANTGSITGTISAPAIIYTGVMNDLDEPTWTANGNAHIEWTSNDTTVATVTKTHGQVYGQDEGEVTITATLYSGSAPTDDQIQLASKSVDIEVAIGSSYGLQGEGGNTLQLTNPNNIICQGFGTPRDGKTVYLNRIGTTEAVGTVTATNNTITFGYTMSAGINNFQETTFANYQNDIKILNKDGSLEKISSAEFGGFSNQTVSITFDVSSLTDGEQYRLSFGPSVCGNNPAKKLNCYLDFVFTLDK